MLPRRSCLPAWVAPALLFSCAAPRPDPSELLGHSSPGDLAHAVESAASAGRAEADRNPGNAEDQVNAAELLFYVIEVRLVQAATARVAAEKPPTAEALLALEDRIEPELAAEISALSAEGRERAESALALEPESVAAQHYLALHTVLGLQVEGAVTAMFRVGAAVRAMERTIELDPAYDSGAPLVLLGRFRDRAPWPHQDRAEAVPLLEQAAAMRATPLRLLYLGDALFGSGDRYEDALVAWQEAALAEAPSSTAEDELTPLYQARARARLALESSR